MQRTQLAALDGIARRRRTEKSHALQRVRHDPDGKPRRNNGGTTNFIVRGVQDIGRELRPDFRIVQGRDIKPGVNEAITSENMARRFENLGLGEKLEINKVDFQIVGLFEAEARRSRGLDRRPGHRRRAASDETISSVTLPGDGRQDARLAPEADRSR